MSATINDNTYTDQMDCDDKIDLHELDRYAKKKNTLRVLKFYFSRKVVLGTTGLLVTILLLLNAMIFSYKIMQTTSYELRNFSDYLIVSNNTGVWALDTVSGNSLNLHNATNEISAFNAYIDENIFWSEINSSTINFVMKSHKHIEHTKLWKTQAIAVDHVTETLYIIDKLSGTVNVHNVQSEYYNILLSDLRDPDDLALDPVEGVMFILLKHYSILRYNMDGTDSKTIMEDDKVTAMTIDYKTKTIYWAIAFSRIVGSNYEGNHRLTIKPILRFIHSMAVVHGKLFWTNIQDCAHSCTLTELSSCKIRKHNCGNVSHYNDSPINPQIIKSCASYELENNPCKNSNCSHFCLLKSNGGHSCACNVGWYLTPNNKTCLPKYVSLMFVQGNYVRAKRFDHSKNMFVDNMIPRRFYYKSLKHKATIDFTYTVFNDDIYFSDDNNIYKINLRSNDYYGDQTKIFSVDKSYRIKNLEIDEIDRCLYYVIEDITNVRSIAMLCLNNEKFVPQPLFISKESLFLIGYLCEKLFSPNWNKIFGTTFTQDQNFGNRTAVDDINSKKTVPLYYYDKYKLVTVDVEDLHSIKIYWIVNTTTTRIEYVNENASNRTIIDLSLNIQNSDTIILFDKWMFVGNSTGIWSFDKKNGQYADEVAITFEEHQFISDARTYISASDPVKEQRQDVQIEEHNSEENDDENSNDNDEDEDEENKLYAPFPYGV